MALLDAAGCPVAAVLAEMADETLALAIQKRFLPNLAFEELMVNRQERSLLRWLYRGTANVEEAQDLLQNLYLKLLAGHALSKYDPNHPFRPWLWRVVHNLWIGEMRRHRAQAHDPDREVAATGPAPWEEAAFHETQSRVEAALRVLPEAQERVLRQAMDGEAADAIAQRCELSKCQVYQLLFKARRQMEKLLTRVSATP
jgi:RNA polymerase sigma factor (sigma-70 family)